MIRVFLRGLPGNLAEPMYQEYEAKCRALRRWGERSQSPRLQAYFGAREPLHTVIAMGIYYRYVVAPFSGGVEFHHRVSGDGNSQLRVGARVFDAGEIQRLGSAVADFGRLMARFGLPEWLLAETDLRRLIRALVELEERRENAEE